MYVKDALRLNELVKLLTRAHFKCLHACQVVVHVGRDLRIEVELAFALSVLHLDFFVRLGGDLRKARLPELNFAGVAELDLRACGLLFLLFALIALSNVF